MKPKHGMARSLPKPYFVIQAALLPVTTKSESTF